MIIILQKSVIKICDKLPVIGAGFAFLSAGLDIFGPKSDSDELKCMKSMRKEMQKLDQKMNKIQKKLEQIDVKLDKIISLMTSHHIYEDYNHYFKEPVLRTVAAFQEFAAPDGSTEYAQQALLFSCYDDNPSHALAWLNRTFHNSDDPSGLRLIDYIFDAEVKCDYEQYLSTKEKVNAWEQFIFYHAMLAATMDQVCFATYAQNKTRGFDKKTKMQKLKEVMKNAPPAFQHRANRMSKSSAHILNSYYCDNFSRKHCRGHRKNIRCKGNRKRNHLLQKCFDNY